MFRRATDDQPEEKPLHYKPVDNEAIARAELLAGDRQEGESDLQIQVCNEWLRLGTRRTIGQTLKQLSEQGIETPTQGVVYVWSSRYRWRDRARAYDAMQEAEYQARFERHRARILDNSLAQPHIRTLALMELAELLKSEINKSIEAQNLHTGETEAHYPNLWTTKLDKSGNRYTEFNHPLVAQYRATLDDIAKETGGRVQRAEIDAKTEHTHVAHVPAPVLAMIERIFEDKRPPTNTIVDAPARRLADHEAQDDA